MDGFDDRARQASTNRRNVGEMEDPDVVGNGRSADRGEKLRMGFKFFGRDGRNIIDRASFQPFGYQTAITVDSSRIVPLDEEDKHPGDADLQTSP